MFEHTSAYARTLGIVPIGDVQEICTPIELPTFTRWQYVRGKSVLVTPYESPEAFRFVGDRLQHEALKDGDPPRLLLTRMSHPLRPSDRKYPGRWGHGLLKFRPRTVQVENLKVDCRLGVSRTCFWGRPET
eukprot:2659958-Rhodomonas_salina.1